MSLIDAIKINDIAAAEAMIRDDKCSIDDVDDQNGANALHYACMYGYEELANSLLAAKANPDVVDLNGRTPLHHIAGCEGDASSEFVALLLVDPDTQDGDGNTALHLACLEGKLSLSKALVQVKARPH